MRNFRRQDISSDVGCKQQPSSKRWEKSLELPNYHFRFFSKLQNAATHPFEPRKCHIEYQRMYWETFVRSCYTGWHNINDQKRLKRGLISGSKLVWTPCMYAVVYIFHPRETKANNIDETRKSFFSSMEATSIYSWDQKECWLLLRKSIMMHASPSQTFCSFVRKQKSKDIHT